MVRIKVYNDQEKVQEVDLSNAIVSIGREAANGVVLPDASVSRRHAQIEPSGNFYLVRDNGSTNGTFVNDMLVRTQVLTHGDVLRIGRYLLRIEAGWPREHDTTRVRVEQLRLPGSGLQGPGDYGTAAIHFENEPSVAEASRERLLRLYEIQAEIGYIDAVEPLLARALDIILADLSAHRGSILLCVPANSTSTGPGAGSSGQSDALAPGREKARFLPAAVRSFEAPRDGTRFRGELVIPEDLIVQASTRFQAILSKNTDPDGGSERSCLVSSLRDRNSVRGVVYLDRTPGSRPFREDDLQFLTAVAAQVAISLSNARLFAEISAEKEKVQAMFTSLTDGVLIVDREFRVVEANTAATLLLGIKEKNPLGASFFDLAAGFQSNPELEVLRAVSLKEGCIFHLYRPGESEGPANEIHLAGAAVPYPRGSHEPQGLAITLKNRSEVERMEDLKSRFLGNVAHKLRSPLTVVQASLPLLRGETGAPGQAEILEEVERSTRALCHLVDEFLEFAEMEVKSLHLLTAPEPARLKPLVQETLRLVEEEAWKRNILLTERVRDDMPPVLMRTGRMSRAFLHILENGVKFGREGGQVIVEAEESGGYVRVDFMDDGPGIPRQEIESVFYVCHQVDEDRTGQVPGAGLGLSIARHIVQEHGGEIRITSPHGFPDRGTRVSVFLPAGSWAGLGPAPLGASPGRMPPVEEAAMKEAGR